MSNMFALSGSTQTDPRRAKLDVVTAAMLNGGASGGWLMGRAFAAVSCMSQGPLSPGWR